MLPLTHFLLCFWFKHKLCLNLQRYNEIAYKMPTVMWNQRATIKVVFFFKFRIPLSKRNAPYNYKYRRRKQNKNKTNNLWFYELLKSICKLVQYTEVRLLNWDLPMNMSWQHLNKSLLAFGLFMGMFQSADLLYKALKRLGYWKDCFLQ